jgi:capsular polysaccharide biosynthesis protein
VLSDPFSYNYYHWTTELIPRIRLFEMNSVRRLLLSVSSLDNRFQTSLLSYAMGGSMVQPIGDAPVRVRDPIVADGLASEQGLLWLRDRTKLRARRGSRRIYIRRGSAGHRRSRGGGVAETPEFCKLIQDYNFDVVEFSADMSVAAQVGMIDGAGIVIAAHGSALTNICYLDPGVALIEILGAAAPRGVYMEIAAYLGLAYQGYMSVETDADQNLVVCPKWLEGLLINFAAHGAPGLSEAPLEPVPSEPPKTPVRRKTHSMSPVAAC